MKRLFTNPIFYKRISTGTKSLFHIRQIEQFDLPGVHALLDENQWFGEKPVLDCVFQTDRSNLFVAVNDKNNVIGHLGMLIPNQEVALLALWLIKKEYRNIHVGKMLTKTILMRASDRNIGGLLRFNEVHNRITSCPNLKIAYTTWYHHGVPTSQILKQLHPEATDVIKISNVPFDKVLEYDAEITTIARPCYLTNWIFQENYATAAYAAFHSNHIRGYGVIKNINGYYRIGPLFADSPDIALSLFQKLISTIPKGCRMGYISPICNIYSSAIADKLHLLKPGFPMCLAYTKSACTVNTSRVYAITGVFSVA